MKRMKCWNKLCDCFDDNEPSNCDEYDEISMCKDKRILTTQKAPVAKLQCSDGASLPDDKEIEQVANDEKQQDWSMLEYADIFADAFIQGAKWMKAKATEAS